MAEALLREAYALLLAPPSSSQARRAAGALVGVAESIDPGLVEEYFWRAASLRQPAAAFEGNLPEGADSQAGLALMLARYDRDLARALLEPIAAQLPKFALHMGEYLPAILAAAAEIDPAWAAELVERLPPPTSLSPDELQHRARLTVAEALARRDDARWHSWSEEYLGLWTKDSEE